MSVMSRILKSSGNVYAGDIEHCKIYKIPFWIDTGSYMMNYLISGDIYKGLPAGRIIQFSGEKSTGKSFVILNIAINFLKANKNNVLLFFETEGALLSEHLLPHLSKSEKERMLMFPVKSIENLNTQSMNIIEEIKKTKGEKEGKDFNYLAIIDSLGMLTSQKELEEALKGTHKRDMTKAQAFRGFFRTITLDFAALHIPCIEANHVYDVIGAYFATQTESGGGGVEYSNSCTLRFSKSKLVDDKKIQIGTTFSLKVIKSRFIAENAQEEIDVKFSLGMDRYSGLWNFLKKYGYIKTVSHGSKGSEFILSDLNKTWTTDEIKKMKSKEEMFTKDVLDYINEKLKQKYGLTFKKEGIISDFVEDSSSSEELEIEAENTYNETEQTA